jgi:stage II sporulation protein R
VRKKLFILTCLAAVLAFGFAVRDTDRQEPPYLRLHVLAHSDETRDQEKKLVVRDFILEELAEPLQKANSHQAALQYVYEHLDDLRVKAQVLLARAGYQKPVRVQMVVEKYPAMQYRDKFIPEGEYWSLKVTVGEGNGHNWWCVLYPPLCFLDINSAEAIPVSSGNQGKKSEPFSIWQKFKNGYRQEIKKIWLAQ